MCKREEPFLELREEQELIGKNCRFQLCRGKHFPVIAAAQRRTGCPKRGQSDNHSVGTCRATGEGLL